MHAFTSLSAIAQLLNLAVVWTACAISKGKIKRWQHLAGLVTRPMTLRRNLHEKGLISSPRPVFGITFFWILCNRCFPAHRAAAAAKETNRIVSWAGNFKLSAVLSCTYSTAARWLCLKAVSACHSCVPLAGFPPQNSLYFLLHG